MLCASMFPAIIGSKLHGVLYLTQTLKFRNPALVWHLASIFVQIISYGYSWAILSLLHWMVHLSPDTS